MAFTPERIASLLGGHWLSGPPEASEVAGAAIDSRVIEPGGVFFALRGSRDDGHRHAGAALAAGASMVVADDASALDAAPGVLLVADARAALGELASAWRGELAARGVVVVGVTGSNGKTTTVRLLHAVLSRGMRTHRPPKSFNNELGVPLTLLNAPADAAAVICELGINAPGEMARLVSVARPEVAVITSIGRAHLEALGSLSGVAREKSVILRGPRLSKADRTLAVVTADSPELDALLPNAAEGAGTLVRVGLRGGERVTVMSGPPGRTRLGFRGASYEVGLGGSHNAVNAAMAAAVGAWLGLGEAAIREGLSSAEGPAMRLTRSVVPIDDAGGSVTLINDAYNANPESMRAAVAALASERPGLRGRRVAVLGDMLELGEQGPALHRELAGTLEHSDAADVVVAVGPLMGFVAERLGRAWGSDRVVPYIGLDESAVSAIARLVRSGDVVLLKGSRSMGLERVASALVARPGACCCGSGAG